MARVKHPKFNMQNITSRGGRIRSRRKGGRWRKPTGIDNKLRIKRKGYGALPKIGFQGPRAGRHSHPSGLKEALVFTVNSLAGLKNVVVRIGGSVGTKKRIAIVAEAKKLGLRVLNPGIKVRLHEKKLAAKKEEKK
ncbi:MAG: eL32 family ribosomal protein [Candidatus Micrarchaeota archaeon]